MAKVLERTKLHIKNQSGLLNHIASVYVGFNRAAMEYIDNAVDAAADIRIASPGFVADVAVIVDTKAKTVSFQDNCGGMTPKKLTGLLSNIGESSKKNQPWTNGQFGFGVHAFRGFARFARFTSRSLSAAAEILIDRELTDRDIVSCVEASYTAPKKPGTVVEISGFDAGHFKKSTIASTLVSEIERHFDDVLRSGLLRVSVLVDGEKARSVEAFDYASLAGREVKRRINVGNVSLDVDLKLLEKMVDNHLPSLTNKGRRISLVSELRSYRAFVRSAGRNVQVWSNPFLVGSIEINDFASPTLTRDDLRNDQRRELVYGAILQQQLELEELIREQLEQKRREAYAELASKISDCLANLLKDFKLRLDSADGDSGGALRGNGKGTEPFGGEQSGGGGPGGDGRGKAGPHSELGGDTGPGSDVTGGGPHGPGRVGEKNRAGGEKESSAPNIRFRPYPEEPHRVIPFGSTITVNTAHADFKERRSANSRFSPRLIAYVSQVVSGPCVEFIYAKRGKPLVAAVVAQQVTDISVQLESMMTRAGLTDEVVDEREVDG